MSLRAITAVWEDSLSRSNDRLVLVAIADAASGDDGTGAILHQDTLAKKAGLSVRTVQRSIAQLISDDELRVERESTRTGNSYTVVVAWKRAMRIAPERNRRQVDVSADDHHSEVADSGAKREVPACETGTDDNLTCVTRHDSPDADERGSDATRVNLTRQIDGGKKATAASVGGSDTPTGGVPDPNLIRTHTTRARGGRNQGTLIVRGEGKNWAASQDRAHQGCHPEVCSWRGTTKCACLPALLVPIFAGKLIGVETNAAIADVIAWAQKDTPPPGTIAPGDDFRHWRERWNATRVTPRQKAAEQSTVPSASDTDELIREMTGGRAQL